MCTEYCPRCIELEPGDVGYDKQSSEMMEKKTAMAVPPPAMKKKNVGGKKTVGRKKNAVAVKKTNEAAKNTTMASALSVWDCTCAMCAKRRQRRLERQCEADEEKDNDGRKEGGR